MLFDMVFIIDLKTDCFIKANNTVNKTLGYSANELVGKSVHYFIHPDDLQATIAVLENKLKKGIEIINLETRYLCKNGEYRWLSWTAHPNIEEEIAYTVARDITELKDIKNKIQISEKKYRGLFNSSNEGICLHELIYKDNHPVDYRILDANPKYEKMTEIKREDAIGALASDLYKTGKAPYLDQYAEVVKTGEPSSFENYFPPMDKHFLISIFSPAPHQFATVFQDISNRKHIERALMESENRYKSLFQNNHAVMLLIDPENGEIIDANPAALTYYGYRFNELIGKKIYDINTLTEAEIYIEMNRARKEVRNISYYRHRLADGDIRDVEIYSGPILIHSKQLLFSIIHDITERKKVEDALKDEIWQRRILVAQSRDGIVVIDNNGGVVEANQKYADMLGYSLSDLFHLHIWDWDSQYTKEELLQKICTIGEAGDHHKTRHRRKDGSMIEVEISSNAAFFGEKKLIFCVCRDITERKHAEEEREKLIKELQNALAEINTLRGILPICSSCKKIRDDKGYWNQIETYIHKHSLAQFSHGICPDCAKKLYGDLYEEIPPLQNANNTEEDGS